MHTYQTTHISKYVYIKLLYYIHIKYTYVHICIYTSKIIFKIYIIHIYCIHVKVYTHQSTYETHIIKYISKCIHIKVHIKLISKYKKKNLYTYIYIHIVHIQIYIYIFVIYTFFIYINMYTMFFFFCMKQLHACRALLQISGDVTVSVTILGAGHRKRFLDLRQRLYSEHIVLLEGFKYTTIEPLYKLKNILFLADGNVLPLQSHTYTQMSDDDSHRNLYLHP